MKQSHVAPLILAITFGSRALAINSSPHVSTFLNNKTFLSQAATDQVSVVTKDQLQGLIEFVHEIKLNKEDESDNCDKRAAVISIKLEQDFGIRTGNIFIRGKLAVPTRLLPIDGLIRWAWHIAPYVLVKEADGKIVPYSLDFSLFDAPVPSSQWLAALAKNSQFESISQRNRFDDALVDPRPDETPKTEWVFYQLSFFEDYVKDIERHPSVVDRNTPERPDAGNAFSKAANGSQFNVVTYFAGEPTPKDDPVTLKEFKIKSLGKQTRCRIDDESSCYIYMKDKSGNICSTSFTYDKTADQAEISDTITCTVSE